MAIPGITRRRFLAAGAAATAAGLSGMANVPVMAAAAGEQHRLQKVGIQLFTVRDLMAESVPGTLDALAELGYQEVEFAGYFDYTAAEVKSMLGNAGLGAPSTHVRLTQLRDALDQTLDTAAEAGHDHVVLAYLAPAERTSLDDYRSYVELFGRAGEAAAQRGLQFGYHNHAFEFERIEGIKPYDLMLRQIDATLMKMTMDLFWIHKAGEDPFRYFDDYPGRFDQCHVKDMNGSGEMVDVGAGTIDFARIFAEREKAGFEHYYVEHDRPENSLASAAASIRYLKRLSWDALPNDQSGIPSISTLA